MSDAYLVGHITVKDNEKWDEYRSQVPATLTPWGAELVFRGKQVETLAGENPHSDIVVIRFPNTAAITGWHSSPAYQALIPIREQAADMVLLAYETQPHQKSLIAFSTSQRRTWTYTMPPKKENKIVPLHPRPKDPFTKDAKKRWDIIPSWAQEKLLDSVWCGKCLGSVTILLETANMQRDELILRGKCKNCGQEVCRLIEPENG